MKLFAGIAETVRRWVRKGAFAIAIVIASSIPIVDTVDIYFAGSLIADLFDGAWTIVACTLLVWIVRFLQRELVKRQIKE